jgi:hypothetical protein
METRMDKSQKARARLLLQKAQKGQKMDHKESVEFGRYCFNALSEVLKSDVQMVPIQKNQSDMDRGIQILGLAARSFVDQFETGAIPDLVGLAEQFKEGLALMSASYPDH